MAKNNATTNNATIDNATINPTPIEPNSVSVPTDATAIMDGLKATLYGDYSTHVTERASNGLEVDSTYFKLASPMGDVKEKRLKNRDLINLSNTMLGLDALGTHATRLKAVTIYKISILESEGKSAVTVEGFKDIQDFAQHMFNIKPTTTNQYIQIARLFLKEDGTMVDGMPTLSTSQCIPLIAVANEKGVETIIKMYKQGGPDDTALLYPSFGAERIKQRLAEYNKGILDIHGTTILSLEDVKAKKEEIKQEKQAERDAKKKSQSKTSATAETAETPETKPQKGLSPIEAMQATLLHTAQSIRDFCISYDGQIDIDNVSTVLNLASTIDELAKDIPTWIAEPTE